MQADPSQQPVRRTIATAAGAVSALDFGDPSAPVDFMFLHANGFNAQTYRQALSGVSPRLRILAPDLRGHGATELPADPRGRRSWRVFARDLLALLDALELQRVTLAGHSLGATTALLAAGRAPDRVRGLVLFEPVVLARPLYLGALLPGSRAFLARNLALARRSRARRAEFPTRDAARAAYHGRGGFRGWPDAALDDYVAAGFVEDGDHVRLACSPAWETANYAAQAHDPYAAFRRFEGPTHILRAERGSTCRISGLARLQRRRPRIAVETVPDTDHFLPIVRPDLTRRALSEMTATLAFAAGPALL